MKKLLISLMFVSILFSGIVLAQENTNEHTSHEDQKTETKKDCKKVCVKRDAYGLCKKFEEKCK